MSYMLSLAGVVRVRHLPTFVSVEPANFCQLRCPEFPVGMRDRKAVSDQRNGRMSMEVFQGILDQVQATAHTMQFYFQGEPLLNPLLPEMIARAYQAGLYTIVSTNAQALTPDLALALVRSGLNRIIVSIDGFSDESYAAYRVGGSLEKALGGLSYLNDARQQHRSSIRIELQVLRLRTNEKEWHWIRQNYRKLGATHLTFKTAQLYDYQHGNALMPTDLRYSRYKQNKDGTYYLHRSWLHRHWINTPCYRLWSGCVITTKGEVLPCCYDKTGQYTFGRLSEASLSALWHNDKATAFRRCVLHNRHKLPMCNECNQ